MIKCSVSVTSHTHSGCSQSLILSYTLSTTQFIHWLYHNESIGINYKTTKQQQANTQTINDIHHSKCWHVGSPSVRQCTCKLLPDKGAGINVAITSGVDTLWSIHNSGYGRLMKQITNENILESPSLTSSCEQLFIATLHNAQFTHIMKSLLSLLM